MIAHGGQTVVERFLVGLPVERREVGLGLFELPERPVKVAHERGGASERDGGQARERDVQADRWRRRRLGPEVDEGHPRAIDGRPQRGDRRDPTGARKVIEGRTVTRQDAENVGGQFARLESGAYAGLGIAGLRGAGQDRGALPVHDEGAGRLLRPGARHCEQFGQVDPGSQHGPGSVVVPEAGRDHQARTTRGGHHRARDDTRG